MKNPFILKWWDSKMTEKQLIENNDRYWRWEIKYGVLKHKEMKKIKIENQNRFVEFECEEKDVDGILANIERVLTDQSRATFNIADSNGNKTLITRGFLLGSVISILSL